MINGSGIMEINQPILTLCMSSAIAKVISVKCTLLALIHRHLKVDNYVITISFRCHEVTRFSPVSLML